MNEVTGGPRGPVIPDARLTKEPGVPIIAREGWPIVAAFAGITAVVWLGLHFLVGPWSHIFGAIGVLLTLWCIWFFRDPRRQTPAIPGVVVSPADGVVCQVVRATPPGDLALGGGGAGLTRVSVFMNVFNVHVNRSPVAGVVDKVAYHPGKFLNASLDKASEHNERNSLAIRTDDGQVIPCVQIAGLVARRIICKVREGDRLRAGQRYGLIRFGSRVDVYLPAGVQARVAVGNRMVAGETVIAVLPTQEAK